jgi:tetratricopeptide (TPR) repeat protein/CHAT domain-containing protein
MNRISVSPPIRMMIVVLVVAFIVQWKAPLKSFLAAESQRSPKTQAELTEADRVSSRVRELHQAGRFAEAVPLAVKVLASLEKSLGPEHPEVAVSLNNLAELYRAQGEYGRAESHQRRALAIWEKALGPDHPNVAVSLSNLAAVYQAEGQYGRAEPLLRRALVIWEKTLGPEDPRLAVSLNNLAVLFVAQAKYRDAEPLHRRAVAILEKALGPDHERVAVSLNNLAQLYSAQGQYGRAEPLQRRALVILEKALGPEHPEVARSLNNLAELHRFQGHYAQAEPLYRQALAIRERVLGPQHPDLARSLHNLAALYNTEGRYAQAEPLYRRALAIREKVLGPEHPEVAISLNGLAYLYFEQARYAQAEPLYRRALAIREKVLGPEHPDVGGSLNNLAVLYEDLGQYAQAEPLHRRALAIREKVLRPEHPDVATSLSNLATLYYHQGQYRQAESLERKALNVREKALGLEHPAVAESLTGLALIYSSQGKYAQAEPLYRRALTIQEAALQPDHPKIAVMLNNLAELYRSQGQYQQAEPLQRRALAMRERVLGQEHPEVATSLNNLALIFHAQRRYKDAIVHQQRGLEILEKTLGAEHPDMAWRLGNLSMFHWTNGEIAPAIALQARGEEIRERTLAVTLAAGSEDQRRASMAMLTGVLAATVSLHIMAAPGNADAMRLAFSTVLRRKGRVLETMTDTVSAARDGLRPEDRVLFDRWLAARTAYATLALRGPGTRPIAQYRSVLAETARELEQREAELGSRSVEVRRQFEPVTIERVKRAIPAGAVLVEIVFFDVFSPHPNSPQRQWAPPRYAAYILPKEGEPAWADLGDASTIDRQVAEWRVALQDPRRQDVRSIARVLDERVMRPIRALLGKRRMVLLSPDGALNLVPFGALVDEHGRYLIETLALSYVASGRELLRFSGQRPSHARSVIFADPDFNDSSGISTLNLAKGEAPRRSADFVRAKWTPLGGTADEARTLKHMLPGALVLTGAAATETALKQVRGPRILHIATHGFFLPDQVSTARKDFFGGLGPFGLAPGALAENPLLRSGLVLAGANLPRSGDDDGILTALEASALNLRGTRLVVLSACETGLGAVHRGEGVYGLRRAFAMAGAETQVMSLWRVEDAATRDLMVAYYRRLLAGGGRADALRQSQLEFAGTSARGHPFFWAAFIPMGQWLPIEGVASALRN